MPLFVLLAHDHPQPHFDLMLEAGSALRTWRIESLPVDASSSSIQLAEPLPDHRLAYLDYEGPVSGDRGTVRRIDRGEYVVISDSPTLLTVELQGQQLRGTVCLTRESEHWSLRWTPGLGE